MGFFTKRPFFWDAGQQIRALLTGAQRKRLRGLVLLNFLGSILEIIGLASVIPYILMVAKPNFIAETPYLQSVYHFLPVDSHEEFLIISLLGILLLFVLKNGFNILIDYWQTQFALNVASDHSRQQALFFLTRDFLYHQEIGNHEVAHKGKNIPFLFGFQVLLRYIQFVGDSLITFLILGIVLAINVWIFLALALVLTPIVLGGYQGTKNKVRDLGEKRNVLQPFGNASIFQISQAFPIIKLYHKEKFFLDRFTHYQSRIHDLHTKTHVLSGLSRKFIEVAAVAGILVIAVYTVTIGMGQGELFLFLSLYAAASYKLMPTLGRLFDNVLTMKANSFAIKSLQEHQTKYTEQAFQSGQETEVASLPFEDHIQLSHVTFRYPNASEPVLKDVNWVIPKGSIVGVAGKSGDGKSTLLYVLMQLLVQDKGEIRVDNQPVTDINRKNWQKQLGLVWHQNFLVDGGLDENIAFAENPASVDYDRLNRAVEQAGLKAFVEDLPNGLRTEIKKEGEQLSAGQKQRIAIARALYQNAGLLIFDEATNALDTATEKLILQSIKTLRDQGKTIVLVSHRFSTLSVCDNINVIENGRLSKSMNYQEFVSLYQEEMFKGEKKASEKEWIS